MQHLAILLTLIIILGTIMPVPNTLDKEETITAAHISLYIICSFSWSRALGSKKRYIVMTVLIPLTEILQFPLPYRNSPIEDLIANIVGTIIGFLIQLLGDHKRHHKSTK